MAVAVTVIVDGGVDGMTGLDVTVGGKADGVTVIAAGWGLQPNVAQIRRAAIAAMVFFMSSPVHK
jgi:hypothetical protein